MMRSLRNRLIAATLAAVLLILLGAAALIYSTIRAVLVAEFDETLLAKAKAVAAAAEEDEGSFELDLEAAQMPEFEPSGSCDFFQIWDDSNATLARSLSLADDSLDVFEAERTRPYHFTTLPDGRPGRQVTLVTPIRTDHGAGVESERPSQAVVKIAVARDTLDLNQTLGRLAVLLGSVTLGAALLSAVVLIVVVRFTLQSVDRLAAHIAEIDAANVSDKGRLACSIKELDPVVVRLNELLDRLNKAFAREKAFTADVAHELRTPLSGLSAALEVCSSRPRDQSVYRDVILKCLGTTRDMQSMVENLLTLTRADAGTLTLHRESLNLLSLARDCWQTFEMQAAERELRVNWPDDVEHINVVTDRDMLRLVLRNLLDNAVRHSDQGGTVNVEIRKESEEIVFEVRNTGCDLAPDETERAFERFWKHNAARTDGPSHCGLGLPLCRRIIESLGGSATATVDRGVFVATVRLHGPVDSRSA